jgi:hypothetical protein
MDTSVVSRATALVACLVAVLLFVYAAPSRLAVGTMSRVPVNATDKEHGLLADVVSFTRDAYIMQAILLIYTLVLFCTTFNEPRRVMSRHIMVPIAIAFAVLHVAIASHVCDATALAAIFMLVYLTVHVAIQMGNCPQPTRRVLARTTLFASTFVFFLIVANIIAAASVIKYTAAFF